MLMFHFSMFCCFLQVDTINVAPGVVIKEKGVVKRGIRQVRMSISFAQSVLCYCFSTQSNTICIRRATSRLALQSIVASIIQHTTQKLEVFLIHHLHCLRLAKEFVFPFLEKAISQLLSKGSDDFKSRSL